MLPPPQVVQQTIMRLSILLANPQLPPPMRMAMQLQMLQAQAMGLRMGLVRWSDASKTGQVMNGNTGGVKRAAEDETVDGEARDPKRTPALVI